MKVHPSAVLPESIPFELDLTRGAVNDNDVSKVLEPLPMMQRSKAHAAFVSSTTKRMQVSDDMIRSFGKSKLMDHEGKKRSLPPSLSLSLSSQDMIYNLGFFFRVTI